MSAGLESDINLKREQSKADKLAKNDESQKNNSKQNKSRTHAKSYKRKAKGKHIEEGQQRKLIKIDASHSESDNDSNSSIMEPYLKKNGQQSMMDKKKTIPLMKPLNPDIKLPVEDQKFYAYTILYGYTEKMKKIAKKAADFDLINKIEGQPLTLIKKQRIKHVDLLNNQELEEQKEKIQIPFDQCHKELATKIAQEFQLHK